MTEHPRSSDQLNAMEAQIALRKAEREAAAQAGRLADRLEEVDIHQREARFLLERAGRLARRRRP